MAAFKNIGIREYLKRYGWKYGIQRGVFNAFPFHAVTDYENKKILYYSKVEKKLKKEYFKAATNNPADLKFGIVKVDNPIWVYWRQGIDNAPDIVKSCLKSIKRNASNEVIIVTDENVNQYVIFPEYIMGKLNQGTMSTAAFSDLLRFSLLEHFGGTWIDATVYLSGKIPEYIIESELFAFQDSFGLIRNPALMSVWFLHCKPNNEVIRETRNIIFKYWEKNNYVVEYLLPYIVLTMVLKEHPDTFSDIPYVNSDYAHMMLEYLDEQYNETLLKHIKELSFIHKLSYKLNEEVHTNIHNLYHEIVCN